MKGDNPYRPPDPDRSTPGADRGAGEREDAPPPAAGRRSDDTWTELWFTLVRQPWRSLAVVPAAGQGAAAAARALAEVGRLYDAEPVEVLDFERLAPAAVPAAISAMEERVASGARVLVAVASPLRHPAAVPIARAAGGAVLLLPLGDTETAAARRIVDLVGADRFLGAITTVR